MKNKNMQRLELYKKECNMVFQNWEDDAAKKDNAEVKKYIEIFNPGDDIDGKRYHHQFSIIMRVILEDKNRKKESVVWEKMVKLVDSEDNIFVINHFLQALKTDHNIYYIKAYDNRFLFCTADTNLVLPQDCEYFLDSLYLWNENAVIANFDVGRFLADKHYLVSEYMLQYPECHNTLDLLEYIDMKLSSANASKAELDLYDELWEPIRLGAKKNPILIKKYRPMK